jgi:hypothetical protein
MAVEPIHIVRESARRCGYEPCTYKRAPAVTKQNAPIVGGGQMSKMSNFEILVKNETYLKEDPLRSIIFNPIMNLGDP